MDSIEFNLIIGTLCTLNTEISEIVENKKISTIQREY